ncbi:glutathione transferase [Pseudomonas sp. RIT-PI-S]|uniref:glutathione transferase n=1 Tax=Pseudomonas sp. RIT-PI-S TaxID=3035295 RepID=UPI0021DA07CA|nr:glutathione transferase [Pseudomonas sp. RIT-PI-S]
MVATPFTLYVDARFTSPYAMSVYVALHEKGLAFDVVRVDLDAAEQRTGRLAQALPTQRVPTLVHDGFTLAESSAITEYLDELYPAAPLYPADIQSRARARQVQAWLRSDLAALRQERSTEVVFYGARGEALSEPAQAAAAKLLACAEALVPEGQGNVFGQWSLADLDLALMLNRLVSHGDPVPERLVAYVREQWQRPSVQAWVALRT